MVANPHDYDERMIWSTYVAMRELKPSLGPVLAAKRTLFAHNLYTRRAYIVR
jgi:hypothetical protein